MRILLVEDDKELCEAIKLQLEKAGYETDCCGSGQEAFYYAAEFPYDVILLDRMLPQMDGCCHPGHHHHCPGRDQ